MLIKLGTQDVTKLWGELKRAAVASIPPTTSNLEQHTNNVLAAIMRGDIDCWVIVSREGDPKRAAKGVVFTGLVVDSFSMTKNMLINGVFSYERIDMSLWADGLETLRKDAKRKGCHLIIGYTSIPRMIDIVKSLGGNTETTLITLEV